jgi:hypothetical protein
MQISSPHRALHEPKRASASRTLRNRLCLAACVLAAVPAAVSTQTLAHPGWNGNGLNTDPWWRHAVFYEIQGDPPETAFKAVATTLDALRALGVDALLLPAPSLPAQPAAPPGSSAESPALKDPAISELEELIHQASRRGMRVLLTLPATPDPSAAARFWLSRGVAGFHVVTAAATSQSGQTSQAVVESMRRILGSAVGQRIVLADFDPTAASTAAAPPTRRARRSDSAANATAALLQIDSRIGQRATLDAAGLRPLLAQTLAQPNLLLGFDPPAPPPGSPDPAAALAKAIASVLLTLHPTALIDSKIGANAHLALKPDEAPVADAAPASAPPQPATPPPPAPLPAVPPPGTYVPYVPPPRPVTPPPPAPPPPVDPLTDWYRQLLELHLGNATLRFGSMTMLDFDRQNALVWVARPATNSVVTPPVVVACNLSAAPVELSIGAAIMGLNLRGTYLRTLLRSDKAMGPQDLNAVILPPFSVYIGELRR